MELAQTLAQVVTACVVLAAFGRWLLKLRATRTAEQMDSCLRLFFDDAWRTFEDLGGRNSSGAMAWFDAWTQCRPAERAGTVSVLHAGDSQDDVWKAFLRTCAGRSPRHAPTRRPG